MPNEDARTRWKRVAQLIDLINTFKFWCLDRDIIFSLDLEEAEERVRCVFFIDEEDP